MKFLTLTLAALFLIPHQGYAMSSPQNCMNVWTGDDAVLKEKAKTATLIFDRKARTLTRDYSTSWDKKDHAKPAETKTLDDASFKTLDDFLSGLCLNEIKNGKPAAPGGPDDIEIHSGGKTLRLGRAGNTGGNFYELSLDQLKDLGKFLRF